MTKIVINADDFGYSRAVNYGIIDAHTEGILTSTTLMTNMPGAKHAFELAKSHQSLGVGVHLTLTCGRPLLDTHHTLVDSNGDFKKLHHYQAKFHVDSDELYDEWKAQIEKFLDAGLKPTHLDSHHHINNLEAMQPVFIRLAQEYQLPVRNNFEGIREHGLMTTDYFEYHPDVVLLERQRIIEKYSNYDTVEIMCHPAYIDKFLMNSSSYATPRLEELDALTATEVVKKFNDRSQFELITFSGIEGEAAAR
ncbi:chitin disaccharide deacetylase [Salinicoccus sp. ID82-1]|uniref:chitin disaccharide deacetylase n=1 Tax=Salinicoccus sp. ID82-1 TaxID=2820269 RepID=UPI001F00980C|nr:chitin disaccharide deacetylase [Salinicoccus sp. ID82-1]MCG1008437.1 chitin disaccharide deacetylase [Salinicoccus sp. ID82-1]